MRYHRFLSNDLCAPAGRPRSISKVPKQTALIKYASLLLVAATSTWSLQAKEPDKTATRAEVWDILQQQEGGPPAVSPLPTDVQLKYHHLEKQLFIHFTVNTFTGNEWGSGKEDPNIFAPTAKEFCKQWVQIAKENGFKAISLTVKHHDGFCLWPSRYTDHSVKSSKWRDGTGDIVREFADACNKEGIAINYYLSPWDRHDKRYGTEAYNDYFTNQLMELMTEYGPVTGVWFDGAFEGSRDTNNLSPFDWKGFYKVVRRYAPGAYIQMMGPDIGWVGNEAGVSPEENWNLETAPYAAKSNARRGKPPVAYIGHTYDQKADAEVVAGGQPNYKAVEVLRYMPREANTSILRGWFWKRGDGEEPKSPQQLRDIYFTSIGRGSTMMLNLAPDQTGLIPEKQVAALKQLTKEIDSIFAVNLAEGAKIEADKTWGGGDPRFSAEKALDGRQTTYWAGKEQDVTGTLTLDLGKKKRVNVFELREPIQMGQRVGAYRMEYLDEKGTWTPLHTGKTIGYRSQIRFPAVTAQKFRLVIEDGRTTPLISAIGLYWNPFDDRKNTDDYKPGETETGTREEGAI